MLKRQKILSMKRFNFINMYDKPPWRNRLARSAVNRKVGGSSPPGGVNFLAEIRYAKMANNLEHETF